MKSQIWIVTANSSIARIFKAANNHEIVELNTLVHPQSRMKGTDLTSDGPGRTQNRMGPGRHAMEELAPIKDHEHQVFAKEISNTLNKAISAGELTKLYIAASPEFLGILRKHLNGQTEKLLAGEINKDLSMLSLEKIREHLPFIL